MRKNTHGAWVFTMLTLLLVGCASSPPRTVELQKIDEAAGYRYITLESRAPKAIDKTAVIVTFSGGGTRAAALADGALRALQETLVSATSTKVPLSSQIDVISSVSGGSVTAAYFALGGTQGLDDLETNFLHSDIIGSLLKRAAWNPWRLFYPRIDIFAGYLDDKVFDHKTYGDLINADVAGGDRRPYVILNASNMASGSVFSFTQDQFDEICSNLADFKLADAVAASAAFPLALTALTIKNRSPCKAQKIAAITPESGWELNDNSPEPEWSVLDRATQTNAGVAYPAAGNLARFRRGTSGLSYLNRDGSADYIQLLDGGITDNLGLTTPLNLLTSSNASPSFLNELNTGQVNKLLLVVVNARGESANDYGTSDSPPDLIDTAFTITGSPIDATSFQLLGRLDLILDARYQPKAVVLVDFDFIADSSCRTYFRRMKTTWTLPSQEVDDLIALGKAMVLQSPAYQDMVRRLDGTPPAGEMTVQDLCNKINSRTQKH